jgi:hypothetical protein
MAWSHLVISFSPSLSFSPRALRCDLGPRESFSFVLLSFSRTIWLPDLPLLLLLLLDDDDGSRSLRLSPRSRSVVRRRSSLSSSVVAPPPLDVCTMTRLLLRLSGLRWRMLLPLLPPRDAGELSLLLLLLPSFSFSLSLLLLPSFSLSLLLLLLLLLLVVPFSRGLRELRFSSVAVSLSSSVPMVRPPSSSSAADPLLLRMETEDRRTVGT